MSFTEEIEMAEAICANNEFGFSDSEYFDGPAELITAIINGDVDNQTDYDLFCSLEPILADLGYEGRSLNRVFKQIVEVPVICTSLEFGHITSREVLESVLLAPRSVHYLEFDEIYA